MPEIFAPFLPALYMLSLNQKLPNSQSYAIAALWGWQVCLDINPAVGSDQFKSVIFYPRQSDIDIPTTHLGQAKSLITGKTTLLISLDYKLRENKFLPVLLVNYLHVSRAGFLRKKPAQAKRPTPNYTGTLPVIYHWSISDVCLGSTHHSLCCLF